jgi:glycosyltransferase XagB
MGVTSTVFNVVNLLISVPLLGIGLFTCYWTTYAWHSPENYDETTFVTTAGTSRFTFSVIVPVRDESYHVMAATIGCLIAQTHPHVQAVLSIGFDDPETLAHGHRLVAEDTTGRLVVAVSHSPVHNKPTQLNAALAVCTGDIVGILDAESLSAPDLLSQVDAVFQEAGVSVVQGGVILTNYRSSWVALRSSLEYYVHHRSKMHFSAAQGAILMGGNTVFFQRSLLEELGGWDETNLAEDAEISLRLLTLGHGVTVAYDPHLVSREEAPVDVRSWVKQRTRWNLGFLQTIAGGVWRQLPARQRRVALWHLLQPSVMSFTGIVFPLSVITFLISRPPLPIAMLTWLPAIPTLFAAVLECVLLHLYSREHGDDGVRFRDYVKLVLTVPIYQLILAFASVRALVRYARGEFGWEKTFHAGDHLQPAMRGAGGVA